MPRESSEDSLPRAQKRFGQNFLTDSRVIQRIIDAVEPSSSDTVVEIGPGRGALTEPLLEKAGRLIAVEFDRNLVPHLTDKFSANTKFKLIEGDALAVDFCNAIQPATKARVVANLPYNIATAILQKLIEQRECLADLTLMLQREVVDRIIAAPGSPDRGYLTLLVEAYCEAEKLFDVGPGSFRPAPKVWSSIVRLRLNEHMNAGVSNETLFKNVVSAGFAQRRKTILNNLRNAPAPLSETVKSNGGASIVLCRAEVDVQRRAETLTLEEWSRIVRALS